jgi:DnaK suppressor protein
MMKKATRDKFKKIFEEQRHSILYNDKIVREDFMVDPDDRPDEVDQATTDTEQAMRMRLRNREMLYLKKIDEALQRINDKTFGECDSCGEDIEPRRLEARPTATLCVGCKEDEERREFINSGGRRHKSLGDSMQTFG